MMVVLDEPPKERGRHRTKVENNMIKRREREFRHQQMWTGARDYYKRWDKANTKFDQWTSPRYYDDNNKMLSDIKLKRDKEELLEKRREKLRRLLEEEQNSYQIELTVKTSLNHREPKPIKDLPTEKLKIVNEEIKSKEEERRKREAELKLYHQWRINNPLVRQLESKYKFKDLKLSWLDQQIEKRMQKEAEEKECQRLVQERQEKIRQDKINEEMWQKRYEEKRSELRKCLDKQLEELKEKQKAAEELRSKESEDIDYKKQLEDLEETAANQEKARRSKEIALYNIKQHKLKLKQRANDIQEELERDKELVTKMNRLRLEESIRDSEKKLELKQTLNEFLTIVKQQQELEQQRSKHLEFLFDSEAKSIYEKQLETWQKEETARKNLLKEVIRTVSDQIRDNIRKRQETQKEILKEREEMLKEIERYDDELKKLKEEEEKRKMQRKSAIEEDIKLKNALKKREERSKLKEIDEELQRVKKEEERLNKEIMEMQKRQQICRPCGRRNLLF